MRRDPTTPQTVSDDHAMLKLGARAALRGFGEVEPNPMVGCVIGHPGPSGVEVLAVGRHRRFGGLHAEADALAICRDRGLDPRGATAWVTLEPCNHQGKQPPCVNALIEAGIARVVYAASDPNPLALGGADALRQAGVEVVLLEGCREAEGVSAPFRKRVATGLPWVIAKWAQTIDGCIATASGDSKWISSEASRRDVHRLRAKVDVLLTGIGTVLADDPKLTARGVKTRRIARRVVIDPKGRLPLDCRLVETVQGGAPLTVVVTDRVVQTNAAWYRTLVERGVDIVAFGGVDGGGHIDLAELLRWLVRERNCSTVMVEAGPRLLGSLMRAGLPDQLWVYLAPKLLGDQAARHAVDAKSAEAMSQAERYSLRHTKRIDEDLRIIYERRDS
ncbi:MAG: bifunctional diaminohydroxyphosphoribosylaminopyrimidine deaminase/5-amino-6-(5-phosphoribosylamino)uracil reductase RibD [Phycisphaerales bacterium]